MSGISKKTSCRPPSNLFFPADVLLKFVPTNIIPRFPPTDVLPRIFRRLFKKSAKKISILVYNMSEFELI